MRVLLRKTSLVDYPGKVAAALFFPGCTLRCPWCQNRELVIPGGMAGMTGLCTAGEALDHILKRRSVLGGVVVSGGEPTVHADLGDIIRRIKALGLPVKLDTNGMNPGALERLFCREESRPDYIALDLKLPPERYGNLAPQSAAHSAAPLEIGEALAKSAALIHASGIDHEFRSLVLPNHYLKPEEIPAMAALVDDAPWHFRAFRPGNCLDPAWDSLDAPGPEETAALARKAREAGKKGIEPERAP
ncbi:MAG: anaerobic ribonucleoside-triphosphate reductase activating protein [Treponema sp.]|jgi:pyruvate formate lyase activating enzyme|nr:anaerobic ribonucleoside-triphosphate reductase activating protein [Treponema sp.]